MTLAYDLRSRALHARATEILADRNRVSGRLAGDYNEDEYVQALEQTLGEDADGAVLAQDDLDSALEELGIAEPGGDVVTDTLLKIRQREILRERGFGDWDRSDSGGPKDGKGHAHEEERIDAMKQAIEELGAPGEKRKDLEEPKARTHAPDVRAAIDRAVEAGTLPPEDAPLFLRLHAMRPKEAIGQLVATGILTGVEHGNAGTPASPYRDPAYRDAAASFIVNDRDGRITIPDEDSMRLHMLAEKRLRTLGKIRSDGTPAYTEEQYVQALEEIRADRGEPVVSQGPAYGRLTARGDGITA
jgi:hypothetical protein